MQKTALASEPSCVYSALHLTVDSEANVSVDCYVSHRSRSSQNCAREGRSANGPKLALLAERKLNVPPGRDLHVYLFPPNPTLHEMAALFLFDT